tara:strand:+ start:1862 stop:2011 length:150 start_codon:yes stop_codon:yes gene_type:complete
LSFQNNIPNANNNDKKETLDNIFVVFHEEISYSKTISELPFGIRTDLKI